MRRVHLLLLVLPLWLIILPSTSLPLNTPESSPTGATPATLALPSVLGDGAVLQRGRPIPVWGRGIPGTGIAVSLGDDAPVSTTVGGDGRWRVDLPARAAGGPITLAIRSDYGSTLRNTVRVGDVYLCSGQSNMQWTMSDALASEEELASVAAMPDVHLLLVPKNGTDAPLEDVEAAWRPVDVESARGFSAVALHFARALRNSGRLGNMPIGLIDSSFGGTRVEAWISPERLARDHAGEALRESMFGFGPGAMSNAMLAPVEPHAIRGVLWYQGESNSSDPRQYERLLKGMIADWRARWSDPALPFLIVQLPNFAEWFDGGHFTWIREAQANVARDVPGTAMVVTIDTDEGFDVHPKHKAVVGDRLALAALEVVYGYTEMHGRGPRFQSATPAGDEMMVAIDSPDGLVLKEGSGGFEVAGADGVFLPAEARLEDAILHVWSPRVKEPLFVRYAWEGNPVVRLYDAKGLPVGPFRTDDAPPGGFEVHRMPAPWKMDNGRLSMLVSGDGRLTSFRLLNTTEFVDSTDPSMPGAWLGSVWGPVRFLVHEKPRRDILACRMENGSVTYLFHDDGVDLAIYNRGTEQNPFLIRLAAGVEVEPAGDRAVVLRSGGQTVDLTAGQPIALVRRDDASTIVSFTLPGEGTGSMGLRVRATP